MNAFHRNSRASHCSSLASETCAVTFCFFALCGANANAGELRGFSNPPVVASVKQTLTGNDVAITLTVRYAERQIDNPLTGVSDRVRLRSYNGALSGPTIFVEPGDTLRVSLKNELPTDNCVHPEGTHNIPNCFNTTNLHTHGLHVAPTGNSDNVFLEIPPGTNFEYEFHIPSDHPAGTFWYHSHRHGSTALQVSSGMAGALIVRGRRTNDIDTILKYPDGTPFDERIFLFQQIQYSCTDDQGVLTWDCSNRVGQIESYDDQFGPRSWVASKRFTSINGEIHPVIQAKQNAIQRWRLVHAGVRDTIKLRITESDLGASNPSVLNGFLPQSSVDASSKALASWTDDHCDLSKVVKQSEIAVDGLTRAELSSKLVNVLQPGYRSDILVYFSKPGTYCVIDDAAPADTIINGETRQGKDRKLLALVHVASGSVVKTPESFIQALDLKKFAAHKPVQASEITGQQRVALNLDLSTSTPRFGVNNVAYSATRFDRVLELGTADEWSITSTFAGHPFHIHVNPYQIAQILKPDGSPVLDSAGNCTDIGASGSLDTQYCDLINVFRDTVFVKQGYTVVARMRYERYIGDFVLHCHILDHEDQGMMENVRIVPNKNSLGHSH